MPAISEAMRGWGGAFGVGVESVYGTTVANTRWLPYSSNSIQPTRKTEERPYMAGTGATQAAHVSTGAVYTEHDAGGDISTWFRYDCQALAMMIAALMGVAPSTSGAGPYVHTFLLDAAGGLFLTGQNVHGSHSTLDKGEIFPGVVVTSMELSWSGRGPVSVKFGTIAQKSDGHAAVSGTVSIQDAQEAVGGHLGVLVWNSLNLQPNSGTLKVDRQLVRRFNAGNGRYTDQPAPGGPTMITLDVEIDWTLHDLEQDLEDMVQSDAVLTFTGASPDIAVFTLDAAQLTSVQRDDGSKHVRTLNVAWQAHFVDTTNRGFKVVLTNGNSAAY